MKRRLEDFTKTSDFFRLVLNSMATGFYAVDTEGYVVLCNAAFLVMFGFKSVDQVIGTKTHEEIHHTRVDGTPYPVEDCPIYRAAKTGRYEHIHYELFFRQDGSSFPVEYHARPILDENDEVLGAICTFIDLTEKMEKEKEIERLRETVKKLGG